MFIFYEQNKMSTLNEKFIKFYESINENQNGAFVEEDDIQFTVKYLGFYPRSFPVIFHQTVDEYIKHGMTISEREMKIFLHNTHEADRVKTDVIYPSGSHRFITLRRNIEKGIFNDDIANSYSTDVDALTYILCRYGNSDMIINNLHHKLNPNIALRECYKSNIEAFYEIFKSPEIVTTSNILFIYDIGMINEFVEHNEEFKKLFKDLLVEEEINDFLNDKKSVLSDMIKMNSNGVQIAPRKIFGTKAEKYKNNTMKDEPENIIFMPSERKMGSFEEQSNIPHNLIRAYVRSGRVYHDNDDEFSAYVLSKTDVMPTIEFDLPSNVEKMLKSFAFAGRIRRPTNDILKMYFDRVREINSDTEQETGVFERRSIMHSMRIIQRNDNDDETTIERTRSPRRYVGESSSVSYNVAAAAEAREHTRSPKRNVGIPSTVSSTATRERTRSPERSVGESSSASSAAAAAAGGGNSDNTTSERRPIRLIVRRKGQT